MDNLHVRWMIRRDMPEVLAIEGRHEGAWAEEDFLAALRNRNTIGMVVEAEGGKLLGFMIYDLYKTFLLVRKLRCDLAHWEPCFQAMIDKLISKLSSHRRTRISVPVSEYDLGMQMALRGAGFHGWPVGDEIVFTYRLLEDEWGNPVDDVYDDGDDGGDEIFAGVE